MNVLIVDDAASNRFLLAEILGKLNIPSGQASNGREAIEAVRKGIYDVVLMDIEMPVMNGIETAAFIRKNMDSSEKRIRIIALTAHNPQIYFEDHKNTGFDQVLTKPFNIDKLSALLDEFRIE